LQRNRNKTKGLQEYQKQRENDLILEIYGWGRGGVISPALCIVLTPLDIISFEFKMNKPTLLCLCTMFGIWKEVMTRNALVSLGS